MLLLIGFIDSRLNWFVSPPWGRRVVQSLVIVYFSRHLSSSSHASRTLSNSTPRNSSLRILPLKLYLPVLRRLLGTRKLQRYSAFFAPLSQVSTPKFRPLSLFIKYDESLPPYLRSVSDTLLDTSASLRICVICSYVYFLCLFSI